jgi:hypothetical protein
MSLRADQAGLLWIAQEQMVVPDADNLRSECFKSGRCHPYSGHYGVVRTLSKAKQLYYWPNMEADIRKWIASCDSCQRVKAQRKKPVGKVQPLQIPGRTWESVSMDLTTDLPSTTNGNDIIWVAVDRLSKMVQPTRKTVTAEQLALLYEQTVF